MNTVPEEPFVPLTPIVVRPNERADVSVTVVPQAENVRAFQPLASSITGHAAAMDDPREPRVTLQRDGGRVSAIHVQCACGRNIELSCVYESFANPDRGSE